MTQQLITALEHPDMLSLHSETVWPEFIYHDLMGEKYWEALFEKFPAFQFALLEDGKVIGTGDSIPLSLDPEHIDYNEGGWDWAVEKGFRDLAQGKAPTVLCGLQIGIDKDYRGKGSSALFIEGMRNIAQKHGFRKLILPIRPTLKHKYPLIPMEEYIRWQTPEGLPYDPWLRAHVRQGGKIVSVCEKAMYIPGCVKDWEMWTGLSLQSSGEYVFPGGLSPLKVDLRNNRAEYTEPNVWMVHEII